MAKERNSIVVSITETELLCKNDCGFYGNPQWHGYCSKCYREFQSAEKRRKDYNRNRELLNFDDFEKKKNQQRRGSNWRSVLRMSPTREKDAPSDLISSTKSDGTLTRQARAPLRIVKPKDLSPESRQAREKFIRFLNSLPKNVALDVSQCASKTVESVMGHTMSIGTDELCDQIQDAYHTIRMRLQRQHGVNETTIDQCLSYIEEYVCIRCYDELFCNEGDEEASDLALQKRIRSLHWVTSGFVETALDMSIHQVKDIMDSAYAELIEMNSKRTIFDKLQCLVRCSDHIFSALKLSCNGVPASADEYLPALILSILYANPPQLQSNIRFISRLALPNTVDTGEQGYYFTNLCCALKFVQNLNHESLKIDKEEFDAYTSGRLRPPLRTNNSRAHHTLKTLDRKIAEIEQFRVDMTKQHEDRMAAVEQINQLFKEIKEEQAAIDEILRCGKETRDSFQPVRMLELFEGKIRIKRS